MSQLEYGQYEEGNYKVLHNSWRNCFDEELSLLYG